MNILSKDDRELFSQSLQLPLPDWDEYWSRIFIDEGIKRRALNYFRLMKNFSSTNFSRMTLSQHRILFFYGPPGTGKTTFARGLANRAAKEIEGTTLYLELRAEELSSENLGEGPKLVAKAFGRVEELAQSRVQVICLIDEVESLLTNRHLTLNNANPVDVFRAVNSVFQQIDRLSGRSNVYLLATSNLPKAVDRAFLDRADLLFYIGLPDIQMRYNILADIFAHLDDAVDGLRIQIPENIPYEEEQGEWATMLKETEGLSGRHLRKLILAAMVFQEEIANDPAKLELAHIIEAVNEYKKRMEEDKMQGGVYE